MIRPFVRFGGTGFTRSDLISPLSPTGIGFYYGVNQVCNSCRMFFRRCFITSKLPICCSTSSQPCISDNNDKNWHMCKGCRYKKCLDIGLNSKYIHERASASNALNNSVQGQQGERQTLTQATQATLSNNRKRKEVPNMNPIPGNVPAQPQIDLRQLLGQVKTNTSQPLIETLPISSDQDSQDDFRNAAQIGQTSRPLSLSAILAAEQNHSINQQPVQQQAVQAAQHG